MPKDKDLKRLTRARMQKTGESYTAARANLLARKARKAAGPQPPVAEPPGAAARAFWFVAKGEAKSQVAVTHAKLATRADVEERKAYWGERLAALAELLKAGASGGG